MECVCVCVCVCVWVSEWEKGRERKREKERDVKIALVMEHITIRQTRSNVATYIRALQTQRTRSAPATLSLSIYYSEHDNNSRYLPGSLQAAMTQHSNHHHLKDINTYWSMICFYLLCQCYIVYTKYFLQPFYTPTQVNLRNWVWGTVLCYRL